MPLTGTVDNANARIDLFVDFVPTPGTQTTATLFRRTGDANAPNEYVRDLFGALLLGEQAYVSDHEAALDREIWYVVIADGDPSTAMTAGPFTIDSGGFVWIKDPGRPWADLRLDLCATPSTSESTCTELTDELAWVGFTDKTRAVDAGLFPVLNRELPADVYARRKGITTSFSFLSRGPSSITSVYELFTAGGPVIVQVPEIYLMNSPYGLVDRCYQPGDLNEEYLSQDQRKPLRLWSAPLTEVNIPVGEPQGTDTANWCVIEDTYATFADLTITGFSWGQVAQGEAATPPPPPSGLYGDGMYGGGLYGG
jgi:hypothetical protein